MVRSHSIVVAVPGEEQLAPYHIDRADDNCRSSWISLPLLVVGKLSSQSANSDGLVSARSRRFSQLLPYVFQDLRGGTNSRFFSGDEPLKPLRYLCRLVNDRSTINDVDQPARQRRRFAVLHL